MKKETGLTSRGANRSTRSEKRTRGVFDVRMCRAKNSGKALRHC